MDTTTIRRHLEAVLQNAPVFLASVINDGLPIISRDEDERISFEVRALKRYYNTQKIRDINYSYLKERYAHCR